MLPSWSETKSEAYFSTTRADLAVAKRAAGQWGVLSLAELRQCGLNDVAVGVRVRRGNLHRLYHGVYAVGHRNLSLEGQFLAAVKACGPWAVLSHFAAAVLHALVRWDGRLFEVTVPSKRTHPRIKAHRSASIERMIVKGIPVTPKLRTVIDLADGCDEQTVKRALRAAKFSAAELAQLPRRILDLGAIPTRSPLEDGAFDVVVRGGLKRPEEVNAPYRLASGTVYPDLRWPELRLIVEVDSAEWHDDPLAQIADHERQAELEAAGECVAGAPSGAPAPSRALPRAIASGGCAGCLSRYFSLARAV